MAIILECDVCGQSSLGTGHPECSIIALEDLLFRIKKDIEGGGLSQKTLSELRLLSVRPREAALAAKREREDKKRRQELWQMALDDFLREKREEFEKMHPEPIPTQFA